MPLNTTITENPGHDPDYPKATHPAALLINDHERPLALRWAFFVSTEAAQLFERELLKEAGACT